MPSMSQDRAWEEENERHLSVSNAAGRTSESIPHGCQAGRVPPEAARPICICHHCLCAAQHLVHECLGTLFSQ